MSIKYLYKNVHSDFFSIVQNIISKSGQTNDIHLNDTTSHKGTNYWLKPCSEQKPHRKKPDAKEWTDSTHVKFKPGKLLEWWFPEIEGQRLPGRGPRRPLGIRPLLCILISVKHFGSVCFYFYSILFYLAALGLQCRQGIPDLPCSVQTLWAAGYTFFWAKKVCEKQQNKKKKSEAGEKHGDFNDGYKSFKHVYNHNSWNRIHTASWMFQKKN